MAALRATGWQALLGVAAILLLSVARPTLAQQWPNSIYNTSNPLKVVIGYQALVNDYGWTNRQEEARVQLQATFDELIFSDYVENVSMTNTTQCFHSFLPYLQDGYKLIFTTGVTFQSCSELIAREYPDVFVVQLAGLVTRPNLAIAFPKVEQARYITGYVAGKLLKKLGKYRAGYVAGMKIPQVIRGINAFYLGLRHAMPTAEMYVAWENEFANTAKDELAATTLIEDHGVQVVTQHVNGLNPSKVASYEGVYSVAYHEDHRKFVGESVLTATLFDWLPVFRRYTELVLNGTAKGETYFRGYEDGSVVIAALSNVVRRKIPEVIPEVKAMTQAFTNQSFDVFCQPRLSSYGITPDEGDCLSTSYQLYNMTYLFRGIISVGDINIPEYEISVSPLSPEGLGLLLVAIFFLIQAFGVFIVTVKWREKPGIKFSSPNFLLIIATGCCFSISSVIALAMYPSAESCSVTVWFVGIGYTLIVSAWITKSTRVYWLLRRAHKLRVTRIKDYQLLPMVGVMTGVEIGILIAWQLVSPPIPTPRTSPVLPKWTHELMCGSGDPTVAYVNIGYIGFLALLCSTVGILNRNAVEAMNETKQIAYATYNFFLVHLFALLILFSAELRVSGVFLLEAVAILWVTVFTMAVIFVPKFYNQYHDNVPELSTRQQQALSSTTSPHTGSLNLASYETS